MTKNKVGRPTKMTESTVQLLEQAFAIGCSDVEACVYAGINKSTLYSYCEKNPGFTDRKETLKTKPIMKAKMVINKALDDGDLATAHKVIDRKEGSRIKQDITSKSEVTMNFQDLTDEQLDSKLQSLLNEVTAVR
ncbi:hypothetical protein [Glaciecola petra]|uniref:Phage protein n=1 Tax=Glaciecola petra TaxID=3075602 RepID=A0ABU2ZTY4_9ALTE|nr:hypothetical protein [Aestuariibacter sp. P117]MDT0596103.1 hypothetical protein [Aestuariibacter sp. P117]